MLQNVLDKRVGLPEMQETEAGLYCNAFCKFGGKGEA
jgi:hypothetical protein